MDLMTVKQGAAELGMTTARVYSLIRSGVLPPGVVVHFGRSLRLSRSSLLDTFIAQGGKALPGGWRRKPTSGSPRKAA